MRSSGVFVFTLIVCLAQVEKVISDGDHHHEHASADAAAGSVTTTHTKSAGPTGSVTTVHSSSGDVGSGGQHDAFAGILSSISPDLISSLAGNPQVASALRSSGIDVGAVSAAHAAAAAGGDVGPPPPVGGAYDFASPHGPAPGGAYDYASPPGPAPGGFPIGGGGGLPFLPFFGPYKQLHVSGDVGGVYPIVEKAIIVVGGGILILVILAILAKAFAKGGLLWNWGNSLSEALAGSASLDIGPFHKSVAGAGAIHAGAGSGIASTPQNLLLTQQVHNGLDQRF